MKNFNDIIIEVITDKVLLKLGIYILATKYLKKGISYFTKVTGDNEEINEI